MFYCYVHRKRDSGVIFYVGKGTGSKKRAREKCGRSQWWSRVAEKHGFTVEIVKYFDNELEAFEFEKSLIAEYRFAGIQLVNQTDGGEGSAGCIKSAESKLKHQIIFTNNWKSQEFREKVRAGKKEYLESDEGKIALSEALKKRHKNPEDKCRMVSGFLKSNVERSVPFKCVETNEVFKNQMSAEVWLRSQGFEKASRLGIRCALIGKYKKAYGFRWVYI